MNFIQKKAREWALKVVNLDNTQVPPSLEPRKKQLISSAIKLKNIVEKVTGNLDSLDALDRIANKYELGLIPQIAAVLGVSATAAWITKWTYEHDKFNKDLSEIKRLENKGVSSQRAYALVKSKNKKEKTKYIVGGLVIAGIFFYFYRKG